MPTDSLTVRRYRESDAEDVWVVHERALRASPIEFVEDAPDDKDLTEITAHYLHEGGEFLVGVVDGTVVATGGFLPENGESAEILRMRVHPDHQGQGYGERILQSLERRARDRGYTVLVLYTNAQLRAARQLYEKNGYEETSRETIHTGDTFVYYRKQLATRNPDDE